jgi:hypothetical protein
MSSKVKDLLFISGYIAFGVLTRTVWHVAPNVEFVTALALAGAYLIKSKFSFTIPLGIMIVSDFLIGNSSIFVFTWSAYGMAYVFGKILASQGIQKLFGKLPEVVKILALSEVGGTFFTIFFFLWTNLGVVLTTSMYPKNIEGVLLSYKMGLPFLWPQLVGNLIIVPVVFVVTKLIYKEKLNTLPDLRIQSK